MKFVHPGDSHRHSLHVLNALYEYDDFMASIRSMVDLGCGAGDDLVWWASATTRDEVPEPLNIRCYGIDVASAPKLIKPYLNIAYQQGSFEETIVPHPGGFDVLWCHDAFQYAINPLQTLSQWWHMASPGGMLVLSVPQTILTQRGQLAYYLNSHSYYHHTMVSLIHMLATSGWDCRSGFFRQVHADPWIHAVVYKSSHAPQDAKTTTWHDLSELELLPESADRGIYAHGYLRQQDLILPWIDKSLASMAQL
jgi:SAM-dependent methyltransferase